MKIALKSDIGLANRIVPMSVACKAIGMKEVDYASSGAKVECPFDAVFHPGGGRAFRIYDDQAAYCYACGERYTPVSLFSLSRDISLDEAAEQLLELSGYTPPTPESRYEEAVANAVLIDQRSLEATLKVFCARNFPDWEVRQFDDEVAHKFRQCVELLPSIKTAEEVRVWLTAAKTAMTKVLGEAT